MTYGFVYACINEQAVIKIGMTAKHPEERMKQLRLSSPGKQRHELIAFISAKDPACVEKELHECAADYWIGGECFNAPLDYILCLFKDMSSQMCVTDVGAHLLCEYIEASFEATKTYTDIAASVVDLANNPPFNIFGRGKDVPEIAGDRLDLYCAKNKPFEPVMRDVVGYYFHQYSEDGAY